MQSPEYTTCPSYRLLCNKSPQNLATLDTAVILSSLKVSMDQESRKSWDGQLWLRVCHGGAIKQCLKLKFQVCWSIWDCLSLSLHVASCLHVVSPFGVVWAWQTQDKWTIYMAVQGTRASVPANRVEAT